jgi:hypothetical protein
MAPASLEPGRAQLVCIESMDGKSSKIRVAVKKGYDVPGQAAAVDAWAKVLGEATLLLYLFRADCIFNQDPLHVRRMGDDARLIAEILRRRPGKLRGAALIGTHYDLVPGYQGPETGSKFYKWHERIEQSPAVDEARLVLGRVTRSAPALVVGSMGTVAATQELTFRLFMRELGL